MGKHLLFVSWAAVSSDEQAKEDEGKFSLPSQIALNKKFVEELGDHYSGYTGTIVQTLTVVGSRSIVELSDACEKYPEYAELVRMVKGHEIDAVVCRSRDRLGRMDSLITTMERMCLQNNVILLPRMSPPRTLDIEQLRDSEDTGFIMAIEGQLAQRQVRWLQAQRDVGMVTRVTERKLFPATVPWGYYYHYDPQSGEIMSIECDLAIQAIIRHIFIDMFVERRMSLHAMAVELAEKQVTSSRNKVMDVQKLTRLIRYADVYAGYISYNRGKTSRRKLLRVKGNHPAMLTEDEYLLIQQERASRKTFKMPTRRAFSGIVLCEHTDRPMVYGGHHTRKDDKTTVMRLFCYHCAKKHSIFEDRVQRVVFEALDILRDTMDVSDLVEKEPIDKSRIEQQLRKIKLSLAETDRQKQKLLELFLSASDAEIETVSRELMMAQMKTIESRREALLEEQTRLEEEMKSQRDHQKTIERLNEVRSQIDQIKEWIDGDPSRANQVLQRTMRIVVGQNTNKTRAVIRKVVFI